MAEIRSVNLARHPVHELVHALEPSDLFFLRRFLDASVLIAETETSECIIWFPWDMEYEDNTDADPFSVAPGRTITQFSKELTSIKCVRCGATFDSTEELYTHVLETHAFTGGGYNGKIY